MLRFNTRNHFHFLSNNNHWNRNLNIQIYWKRRMSTNQTHTNRLVASKSPYLRQHMHNPVDWYEWSPEALKLAKDQDKPIFLSVGYSACHWCHVMERESFENQIVAKALNDSFVSIKVDREERPDIDRIYMSFVQATTGSGGWPMSVFLTPDLKPIFGGTYFPGPEAVRMQRGRGGFLQIIEKIDQMWNNNRETCIQSASNVIEQMEGFSGYGEEGGKLEEKCASDALNYFKKRFDTEHGGFGGSPKFPTPINLTFLLRMGRMRASSISENDAELAKQMALKTLRGISKGGIRDHIGYGISRYSVTKDWSLPHFEIMLYDQGQLMGNYLDAWLLTGEDVFLSTLDSLATYLGTQRLSHPGGGFYSAEDADSLPSKDSHEKKEGAFYVWEYAEFEKILGKDADIAAAYWNVKPNGNVDPRHDAHDELLKKNVLCITFSIEELAKKFGKNEREVNEIIQACRRKLWEYRQENRPFPHLDDKIVTSWNGLAIGSLARAAASLKAVNPSRAKDYLGYAEEAASFVKKNLYKQESGRLIRVFREEAGKVEGFTDDYAFLIGGILDLYETTFDSNYIRWALKLQETQDSLFWDETNGGYFSTSSDASDAILRLKDEQDNAEPSSNAISASNLMRLSVLVGDRKLEEKAIRTCQAFSGMLNAAPYAMTGMVPTVIAQLAGMRQIVVVGSLDDEKVGGFLSVIRSKLSPNTVVMHVDPSHPDQFLLEKNEIIKEIVNDTKAEKNRVHICEGFSCGLPITHTSQLESKL
eukprot:TRINITY_DN5721_c0_g1_i1.p1 TRINITY_DN5721_c0_g1~~TRINITY_DN5721_c0_g1_i1.p1  ORF type:complete len:760 (+),score=231.46 TRINITY_DN5721_c0_g1_i1:112-2391(+)